MKLIIKIVVIPRSTAAGFPKCLLKNTNRKVETVLIWLKTASPPLYNPALPLLVSTCLVPFEEFNRGTNFSRIEEIKKTL